MVCLSFLITLTAGYSLKPIDVKHINQMQKTCQTRYEACLNKVEKVNDNHFRAICGNGEKKVDFEYEVYNTKVKNTQTEEK